MTRNKIFRYLINQSYKNLMIVVIAMAMILALCADYAIAEITPNLLYNPNADLGLDGWTVTPPGSFTTQEHHPWNPVFRTETAGGSAYQDVNISQYADAIDNGGITVNFSTSYFAWTAKASLRISCMDENQQVLDEKETAFPWVWGNERIGEMNMQMPAYTRYIRAEMYIDTTGVVGPYSVEFDNLSLTLLLPELQMITSEVNFGNLYVYSNGSTWDYNNLQKQVFQFMNSGPEGSKLSWSISSTSSEVSLDPTNGSLDAGGTQNVYVSLQPLAIGNTTIESDYTLRNDAWLREDDGAIRLTPNEVLKNGQAEYSNLPLGDRWNVSGEFWTGWGAGNGGDAFYIYVWADSTPEWQEDDAGHYSINFYEYYDRIELRYNGVLLASVYTPYLDVLRWYSFRVTFHEGTFTIWCDGSIRLTYTDNLYQSRMSGNLFGFGGRTGAATNEHWVRYMKWSKHIHAIHLETACGNIDIPIVANAYHLSQPIYVGPKEKGPNGKVNVASNTRVPFEVNEASTSNPDVTGIEYQWQKVVSGGDLGEFEPSTVSEYNFTFDNPGDWTVYCKYVEKVKRGEEYYNVESDLVEIPVRAWNRPTVNDTPPSSAIDACTVSWYGDKYVGVVGEPVRLMADGATNNTGNDNPPEAVAKYIWYFDDGTVEQPAGQAMSYTWDSPNLSGQIRCKAETNYGVQSDEKLFNLTIYDAVEPNAAGPYTGRPNTAVTLQGSAEKTKYPGAAFQYQWRVNSITPVGVLKGEDATLTAEYVQLTPNEPYKSGQFEYADLPLSDDWNVTGEFWSGDGTGVDAFYIYLWANGTPMTEDEAKGQYSINFDEYQDQIQFNYDGVRLADAPQPDLDNSQWRRFAVVFKEGIFCVYLDGKLRLTYDDSANYQTRMSNNLFGFGARAGASHNYHRVRNMKWTTGTPVATDSNCKAENVWGPTGNESDTYGVEFTTTVTTEEGLVLIGSSSTSVTVEAGKPTAMPGGPYRCGIYGGSFSPNQFEGNHSDYVEADDVGHIVDWMWFFSDRSRSGIRQNSGDFGYALEFDGVGDYVEAAAIDERSVEMWIKPGKEAQMGLYSGGTAGADGENYSIAIYERNGLGGNSTFDSNSAGLFLSFHGYDIAIPYDGILSKWHYIAISWDGGTGVLIGIDGQFLGGYVWDGTSWAKQSEQPFTLPVIPQPDPTAPTRIGGITGSGYFDGIIDEVAIWDVALTKDEILAHLDNSGELVGDEQGLVLYWKLEETEGMTAHDQSPNGNDGTLNPMTPVWNAEGHPVVSHGIWNPTHAFTTAGEYTAGLIVQSEFGKWSYQKTAKVEAVDGKIAGYVRAADLRTPVKEVTLTLTSSHVYESVLAQIATSDDSLNTTGEGGLQTLTDDNGYYEFAHIPLGSYRIRANKGEGDAAHEFEKEVHATELTLDGPNQLAIDFVDISVYPVGGRIVYSIQKNGQDVLVEGAKVKAYPIGSTSFVEALLSKKSLSATGTNYSMPLFAGKYLFVPELSQRDIRIKEDTPGYDSDTQLVTIEDARTDIDFVDYTKRELTVFVEDPGGYRMTAYPDTGDSIKVTVSGINGQVSDMPVDEEGKILVDMNPGEYTVTVTGASPETMDVDLRGGDQAITMTIPVQIELSFSPRPKLFGANPEFLEQFGLTPADNPEGYMYYYPPEPRVHTYTITASANGKIIEDFILFVTDEVSMRTADAPVEQDGISVSGGEGEYTIEGGLPKKTTDDPPLAAPKKISFRAQKEGYLDSYVVEDEVIVLGDVSVGTAAKIVSIPVVNYTVLHDPPGDGSHAYLDDSMSISGIVHGMTHKINDVDIPVYPSPWSTEREIKDVEFEENQEDLVSTTEFQDLKDKGLIGYRNSEPTLGHFSYAAAAELGIGGAIVAIGGPISYALQLVKFWVTAAIMPPVGMKAGMVQYEISPSRRLKTPSGDTLPDLLGPGKGDIYFGEGWTLGLQTKYRLGIKCTERDPDNNCLGWQLTTKQVETYDILERTNQYIYTPRDIENIIDDLGRTIEDPETTHPEKLQDAKDNWENLLNQNYAYIWSRHYLSEDGGHYGESLDAFFTAQGLWSELEDGETLIFSAGPTFEYSRTISESHGVTYSVSLSASSNSNIRNQLESAIGFKAWGAGVTYEWQEGSTTGISSNIGFSNSWKNGSTAKQTVGFVLHDNDIGDNIATRVIVDPRWGTPMFFAEPGSYTSDPWEPGTNKSVDFTMELLDELTGPFDYHDGAHYEVKLTYEGQRELESSSIGFLVYASAAANTDNLTFRFNGSPGSCGVFLSKETRSATVVVSVYPPEVDTDNFDEKEYPVVIGAKESTDVQISRKISRSITFADLRAPRATITAPYDGERISPVFFPQDTPFEIEVVSEDTDLKSIQLQIHSKQPNGVWEPWSNLTSMLWEDGGANENVTVFDRLERKPPRREFTFQWTEDAIRSLGVGEYALRAIATDKATTPNVDIDSPSVVFLVDDAKPSVLNSIPDYQARESERIYRGELSITFTDDMRATDFDDRTFYVMDLLNDNEKVAGYVSYSPALRKTVFVPIVPFQPNGFYRVEIKTDEDTDGDGNIDERGVHDLAGNPLDNAFMWTFRTTDAPFEPTWSLTFSVDDGVSTDANNIASVEYGAIDDEDEKDVRAVPALSSQLSMSYLNQDKVEFDRDIRPADGRLSHHWFFVICDAANGSSVTIRYRPSIKLIKTTRQYQVLRLVEFDSTGQVTNTIALDPTEAQVDPDTGFINEVVAYEYTNQGEASRYFRLDVQKVGFVAGVFEVGTSGWKFFSVPITPQRAEPFVNLGDDIDPFRLYKYDTQLGGYKVYPFDIGEVGLQTGHGYFTRLEEDVEVDVGGASNYDDVTLDLDAVGWYPIGNPFLLPVGIANLKVNGQSFDTAVASGLVEATLYRWNIISESAAFLSDIPISDSYETVTSAGYLNAWDACWLKTNQADLTLTIPAPDNLPQNPPLPERYDPPMAPVAPVEHAAEVGDFGYPLAGQFDLKLALTSTFASDLTTTLGTHPKAQVGWDALDSTEPPILGETVAAYFEHTDWGNPPLTPPLQKGGKGGLYNRDYQPTLKVGEQRTWKFAVYTKHPDAEMNLSWEKAIAQVPGDIMLYFRRDDGQADWQEMRKVQSVNLTSHLQSTKIPFEVRAERFEMAPPSDVEVVAGEKQVLLRWKVDDNKFISGYTITRNGFDTPSATQPKLQHATRNTQYAIRNTQHEFVDTDVAEEVTYTYQVTVHFESGAEVKSELFTVTVLPIIKETVLLQSYPNPFNPETWIPYELAQEADVRIDIYNASGQLIRTLELGRQSRGRYVRKNTAAYWDGRNRLGEHAANGLYFYVLKAGNFTAARKMVIVK